MDPKKLPVIDNFYNDMFPPLLMGSTPTPTGDDTFSNMSKMESSNLNNQNILMSPGRGSERKKNIIKMMQKLDKIKTGENSPSRSDSLKIKDKENNPSEKGSTKPSKFKTEKKEEEKNNFESNKEEKVKGLLKKSNNEDRDEAGIEDDSKLNIINKDEGFGLNQKSKKKVTGVKFKENLEENKSSEINDSFNYNNFNYNNKFQTMNSNTNLNGNYTPGEADTISALNQKEINNKYNTHMRLSIFNKYNINESLSKEELEKKIVNMTHSNLNAKILLNIGLFVFICIYITSYVIYCLYDSNLEKARNFTFYYFQRTSIMNEIILNYQLHLIKNIHDEEILKNGDNNKKEIVLETLVQNYETNSDKLIDFNNRNNINSILKETSNLINILSGKSFCENFAGFYLRYFTDKNIKENELKDECLIVGEKINTNGYTDAESYSFTTVSVYIEDWKNFYSFDNRICQEYIKGKLNEQKYINTIEEMMFISSKFTDVLHLCLFNDYDNIFDKIKTLQIIFGLVCIILEILFFVASILVIIYPIRSIDIIINWFSKKYGN